MDQLIFSRFQKQQEITRLDNLSPEKLGKNANAKLTYTPSKLANNPLFKQAALMKKTEENGSKLRQSEALNQILKDKVRHVQAEKQGIQKSLFQQIVMYKTMLAETEQALQSRVKELQTLFSEQMKKIIMAKEEEAKYVQAQKQMMENRIYQLEEIIAHLKQELSSRTTQLNLKQKNIQKLELQLKNSGLKANDLNELIKRTQEKAASDRNTLQQLHLAQLEKVENQRTQQNMLKNKELKQLAANFQEELKKLKDIIIQKDKLIQTIEGHLNTQKEKLLATTKQFTLEVSNLHKEKQKVEEEVQTVSKHLSLEKEESIKIKSATSQTSAELKQQIEKLTMSVEQLRIEKQKIAKDLQKYQLESLKQREKYRDQKEEMKKQIVILRKNAENNSRLTEQNSILTKKLKNMEDLLYESCSELERCKGQFLRLGSQNECLLIKLKELDIENQTLHRMSVEQEEEAQAWRQSYYKYRK